MLLTISNLYPRPDEDDRGLFNAQFFDAVARQLRVSMSSLRSQLRRLAVDQG